MSSLMGKKVTFDRCTFVNILKSSLTKTSNIVVKNFTLEVFEFCWLVNMIKHLNQCYNTVSM